MNKKFWKNIFSKRFTFMIIPHGLGTPKQINIPVSFIFISGLLWTSITFWGSYLSAQHIDYWRTKLSNEVLKLKISYLLTQIEKSNAYLDQVKDVESQLRTLLHHQNTASSSSSSSPSTGGPSLGDQNDISLLLTEAHSDLSWERLVDKVDFIRVESEKRLFQYKELSDWIDQKKKEYRATPMGMPCPGRLTSHFGKRLDPFSGEEEFHCGLDIAGAVGTPIRATADGVIRIADWHSGYGNLIVIEHPCGYSTRYGHNSRLLKKEGQKVSRGDAVALMGATGKASGPHSHYEIWRYNHRLNPFSYLKVQDDIFATPINKSNPQREDSYVLKTSQK